MKISVIGCGWLGLPLAEFLVKKGYIVKGSTTSMSKLEIIKSKGIQPFLIDLNVLVHTPNMAVEVADFFKSDMLFINIPPGRRNPNVGIDYPKWMTFLAKKCAENNIKKVIFVSSTGVYPNTNQTVTEATNPGPQTNSQKAIVTAEQLFIQNKNFETTVLRPSGLVGGNRNPGRWFAGKQQVSGGNIPVNLVHLEDCIGVAFAVIEQNVFGEIINICADEHPLKGEIYPALAEKYGFEKPTFIMDIPTDFKIVSNQKSKTLLNYQYKKPNPINF